MLDQVFEILFEDEAVIGVCKPAGVATQAPAGIDNLEARIKLYLGSVENEPLVYLGIPHRLDRAVSGAIVFAKTRRAARQLSRQFERRQVTKIYWAAVGNEVDSPLDTWTDYLWKVHGHPKSQVVESTHPDARLAILNYRTIGAHRHGSWLEVELETGRTHQIRIQAASRGFAIVGDAHYGSEIPFGPQAADERLRPIALHARSLTFIHPTSQTEMTLEAPLPDVWNTLELCRR